MARVIVSDTLNVRLIDSGDSVQISGAKRENVELVLKQLMQIGATMIDEPHRVGTHWIASCRRTDIANAGVEVEKLGQRFFIRGRTLEAVHAKVVELTNRGARLEGGIDKIDDFFIAICHEAPHGGKAGA